MKRIILTIIIFVLALFKGTAQEGAAKSALAEGDYQAAIKLYQVAIATCNNENKSADLYNSITNAQKCEELLGQANEAYKKKKYSESKKLYQSILKYNPSDKFSKKRVSLCSNNTSKPNNTNTQNTNKESKPSSTYSQNTNKESKPSSTYSQNTTKKSKPSKGTANGHEYVDLGLSVKWATCNVGANKPEDSGHYFAWGEIKTKSEYTYNTANNKDPEELGDISGNPKYDAARANWGGEWRMPKFKEFIELIDNCIVKETTQNGVNGFKFTSKTNGNSIFFPAGGHRQGTNILYPGIGNYWSSTPNYDHFVRNISFNGYPSRTFNYHWFGYNIRPVIK